MTIIFTAAAIFVWTFVGCFVVFKIAYHKGKQEGIEIGIDERYAGYTPCHKCGHVQCWRENLKAAWGENTKFVTKKGDK